MLFNISLMIFGRKIDGKTEAASKCFDNAARRSLPWWTKEQKEIAYHCPDRINK
jgi:hypothetical protein